MDIGNAVRRAGREDITTRSVIANTISQLYNNTVKIQSVVLKGNIVIIKTGNPLINSELNLMKHEIETVSKKTLLTIGIKLGDRVGYKFI